MAVEFVACLSVYEQLEETTGVANEIYIVEWKNKNNLKKRNKKKRGLDIIYLFLHGMIDLSMN